VVRAVCVYPVLCGVRLTPHSTGYTHSLNYNTENLLTMHFNDKNLKKCNFSKDQRGPPEDGPYGLKRVVASNTDVLTVSFSILYG
jgi:hypothetical protein